MNAVSNPNYERWNTQFAGDEYFYGFEPSPMARRGARYQRALPTAGGRALDVGCGEGQDVVFFAQSGYKANGVELTQSGIDKAKRLLQKHDLDAQLWQRDVLQADWTDELGTFDLVQSINCLQFFGENAPTVLRQMLDLVNPNGVVGVSVFAREEGEAAQPGQMWLPTRAEVLALLPQEQWQPLEVAQLWQWGLPELGGQGAARLFVTVLARRSG